MLSASYQGKKAAELGSIRRGQGVRFSNQLPILTTWKFKAIIKLPSALIYKPLNNLLQLRFSLYALERGPSNKPRRCRPITRLLFTPCH